jgi:hypothetical protein
MGAGGRTGGLTGGTMSSAGSLGPSIGRTGPVLTSVMSPPAQVVVSPDVRVANLQGVITRSPAFTAPGGVNVRMDGTTVVLQGRVASADERRLAENMLRLQPGVRGVRNELQVPATSNP